MRPPRSTLLFDAVPPRYASTSRIPSARPPTANSFVDAGQRHAYRQMTFDRYGDNRSQRSGYQRTTISIRESRGSR